MPNIGRYEIESRIGRGGMGDVYRAYDPTLRRRVAIKVLKVEGDEETLNRFRLEATAAGNLNHANIVTVYDYGVVDGEPYLVMEYLEGQDVQRTVESGKKFDLVEITDIMSQVSDALECAHQHGVIHRDVKPANIMLLNKGGVKLMDFGIARLAGSNTSHTKAGHLIGTVLYMSPEQFHNLELDVRVDIWAYGVIYYELLAGKHPFQVPDQIVTMYNIANKPAPPICSINQEVPEALGQIVDRCLAKDRDQRYRSMEEVRFDALPVLQDLSKQQAARMLNEARILMDKSDWDGAQSLIKRVLELDPAERSAQTLRRSIAEALRKRETGPRIDNLVKTADQCIAEKQYVKALEAVETAIRIDSTAPFLRQKADEVKDLIEREKRAAELLRAAQMQVETQNLTDAYRNLAEVLRISPGMEEGTRLMASVQEDLQKRERQRVLQDGLAKARNLLRINSYDEAIKTLQDLSGEFAGTLEIAQLLREAENAREEDRRRRRFQDELAAVKEQLRLQRFSEAIQRLESLISEFPGQNEVQDLLRYAREEWKVRQRAEDLDRVKAQVAKLQNDGRFEEAMRFLERSISEYPDEADLLRLSQAVSANKSEADRRAALEQAINEARGKQRAGELTEALRLVDLGLRQHGPDENLNALRDQLERDWQNAQRKQALDKAIAEGRQFSERREWEKAIAHFQLVSRQYPDEAEPRRLLSEAETNLKREQKQRAEQEALTKAAALEKQGQREAALTEIDAVLRQYPDSSPLAQTKARLQKEIDEHRKTREREAKLEDARRKAQAEQERRAREAEEAAETQRRELAAKVEECLAKAYLAIGHGDLAKAGKLVGDARKLDANHPGIQRALNDVNAAQTSQRQQTAARALDPRLADPAPKSFPIKAVAIGGIAAVAAAAAIFFFIQPKKIDVPKVPLTADPESVEFAFKVGGTTPDPVKIGLKGSAGSAFSLKVSDPWISVSPESGSLPATVLLTAKPDGLAAGPHAATVNVSSGEAIEVVKVSVDVTPPAVVTQAEGAKPELKVIPELLSFAWEAGSPSPAPKTLYLSGSGRYQAALSNSNWVSISSTTGRVPAQIVVTVHPEAITAGSTGSHTSEIAITSPDLPGVRHVAYIKLVITEKPKAPQKPAVIENKPPVVEKPPVVTEEKKPVGGIFLGGARNGDLVWTGSLPPGGKVVIGPGGVMQGGGQVVRAPIPRGVAFDVSNASPGVQATAGVNSLTLTNVSSAPILSVTVHWAVK